MISIKQNGISIKVYKTYMTLNDERVELPTKLHNDSRSMSVINGMIFIDGWKYNIKTNEFKKGLKVVSTSNEKPQEKKSNTKSNTWLERLFNYLK